MIVMSIEIRINDLMQMDIDILTRMESELWNDWCKVKKVLEMKQMIKKEAEVDNLEE